VDDEPEIIKTMRSALECAGFRVITASDGNMGLAPAEREQPDLAVVDMMIPPSHARAAGRVSLPCGAGYKRQQPGPQGGNLGSQLIGKDEPAARGLAGTLRRRSTWFARHAGQTTGSLPKTSSSNVCSQRRQEYSYSGMAPPLGHFRLRFMRSLAC
jgi:hypothetical protein